MIPCRSTIPCQVPRYLLHRLLRAAQQYEGDIWEQSIAAHLVGCSNFGYNKIHYYIFFIFCTSILSKNKIVSVSIASQMHFLLVNEDLFNFFFIVYT